MGDINHGVLGSSHASHSLGVFQMGTKYQSKKQISKDNLKPMKIRIMYYRALLVYLLPWTPNQTNARLIKMQKPNSSIYPNCATIVFLHFPLQILIAASAIHPVTRLQTPIIVINHPFPIALKIGSATTAPVNEKIFLTKLFNAIPLSP